MATRSANIPVVPAGDGPSVAVGDLVGQKTVVLSGFFQGSFTLFASHDGTNFAPVLLFNSDGQEKIALTLAESYAAVRLRTNANTTGSVTASISGVSVPGQNSFVSFPPVAVNASGPQPSIDTFALVPPTGLEVDVNVIASATLLTGTIIVEGSNDNLNFNTVGIFSGGQVQRALVGFPALLEFAPLPAPDVLRYYRINVQGKLSSPAVFTLGGGVPVTGGGGVGIPIPISIGPTLANPTHNSVALGVLTTPLAGAIGTGSFAAGNNATANGALDIVIGDSSDTGPQGDCTIVGRSSHGGNSLAVVIVGRDITNGDNSSSVFLAGDLVVNGAGSDKVVAIGRQTAVGSSCRSSIAMGTQASVSDNAANAMAIGPLSAAGAPTSIAFGPGATTADAAVSSIAVGNGALVAGASINSLALGLNALVDDVSGNSLAIGPNTHIFTNSAASIAIGSLAKVGNGIVGSTNSTAIGNSAVVVGTGSTALGFNTSVTGTDTTALGSTSAIVGNACVSIGTSANINNSNNAVAIGSIATVGTGSDGSVSIGSGATIAGASPNSISIGPASNGTGNSTVAIGSAALAIADNTIAIGTGATAPGASDICIGNLAVAGILTTNLILIGQNTSSNPSISNAIAIGNGAGVTTNDQCVIGGTGAGKGIEELSVSGTSLSLVRFLGAAVVNNQDSAFFLRYKNHTGTIVVSQVTVDAATGFLHVAP
jgi:hypothetical protein